MMKMLEAPLAYGASTRAEKRAALRIRLAENSTIAENGCWNWNLGLFKNGYAKTSVGGKTQYAHRASYRAFNGPIKEGQVVRHTCDNPRCINPGHLLRGTQADNVADCLERGRFSLGDDHATKLTSEIVKSIRKDHTDGLGGYKILAKKYGVDRSMIQRIVKGWVWKHVQ